jgi:hypothetical protein
VLFALSCGAAVGFFAMLAAGHSMAFSACHGQYSFFAENVRCRWPAVWGALLLVFLVVAVVSFSSALWHHVRSRRRDRNNEKAQT